MQLYESGEMYLETIYILLKKKSNVRSIDVVREMCFSKPSVSNAMKNLKNGGYILIDEDGYITLTAEGKCIAEKIYERHVVISKALELLGVDSQTAAEDACRIEHDISDTTFEALKKHMRTHDIYT